MTESRSPSPDPECQLLERWRAGDTVARDKLISELTPWLQSEIRRVMGGQWLGGNDSGDLTQNVVLNFLTWGPEFIPANGAQLRGALKRIAMNELIDQRRSRAQGARHVDSLLGQGGSFSGYGMAAPSMERPSRAVEKNDEASWVRLALQFLEPEERYLLVASEVEGHDWETIAKELGLPSADAARVRAMRLKPRLANLLRKVKGGLVPESELA